MWTRFMDMHSGGSKKEDQQYIYIQAPEEQAKIIFQNRFGHNPNHVTCTCCGNDYSIYSDKSIMQLTAYDRNCEYDSETRKYIETARYNRYSKTFADYKTLAEYKADPNVLFIYAKDIKPEERQGELKTQGYVWIE